MFLRLLATFTLCSLTALAVAAPAPDGSHDFDFELGTWKTHVKRLVKPLTGSTTWVEMNGNTTVKPVWGGRANLVELEADGPNGHFRGLSLRLYNPETQTWSLNFANAADGTLTIPTVGRFKDGRGEFFNEDTLGDKPILVRFVITPLSKTEIRFEQSFSANQGKTWEVNWIATDTKVPDAPK
jgi:hypothetical protein